MELDEPTEKFQPVTDPRPRVPAPPPVKLAAIDHIRVEAPAGIETHLDAFYIDLLRFERPTEDPLNTRSQRPWPADGSLIYQAENADIIFTIVERPREREDYRAIGIEIPHFKEVVHTLEERETPYEWQKGLAPGHDAILIRDPAGNWLRISGTLPVQ